MAPLIDTTIPGPHHLFLLERKTEEPTEPPTTTQPLLLKCEVPITMRTWHDGNMAGVHKNAREAMTTRTQECTDNERASREHTRYAHISYLLLFWLLLTSSSIQDLDNEEGIHPHCVVLLPYTTQHLAPFLPHSKRETEGYYFPITNHSTGVIQQQQQGMSSSRCFYLFWMLRGTVLANG